MIEPVVTLARRSEQESARAAIAAWIERAIPVQRAKDSVSTYGISSPSRTTVTPGRNCRSDGITSTQFG